jgi:hypothetical protein
MSMHAYFSNVCNTKEENFIFRCSVFRTTTHINELAPQARINELARTPVCLFRGHHIECLGYLITPGAAAAVEAAASLAAGRPDLANFRPMADCLPWASFRKLQKWQKVWVLLFSTLNAMY